MNADRARARLLAERSALLGIGHDLAATFDNMVDAARDSNLDDEHDPEGSTIAAERSLIASLSRSAAARLEQIDQALQRVDDGSYGRCQDCGQALSEGRLEARPEAARCVPCATRHNPRR